MTAGGSADPYGTLVPDGQYRVGYVTWEEGNAYGRSLWFGHFKITEPGEYNGLPILRVWNKPKRPYLPRSHNLALDYMALTGCYPRSAVTPDELAKGCELLAETATVKHEIRGKRRIERPEGCWYSKIDRLIRITAGSPPCMRSRGKR